MAANGTPVGNMIIKVDLDSTGVEKNMTGLQRQLKSSNKAMGAQLSAFDRGEKSASKYGVMIEGLTNRHRIQGRMVEEARAKHRRMSDEYGENSVKAQKASQELNEQIARYQETGRELDNVTAEFQAFQEQQELQSKGWYKVADGMENYGGKLKSAGKKMDETGRNLTRKVTLPLTLVGGAAIKTGMDFESGMSRVAAVSGASADDMEKLEGKAREMGRTTVFSASEASDAFYYMSLAGWDAEQSMDGIAGVMDLAAASGEDLALVSDIVTDGLTAFGLEAKESGRFADVLAAASANANTDVRGMGDAFKYAAPVAGALGFDIEDVSVAIGLMSNAGIKGQKSGTALRTMMTNLAKPTEQMKDEMDKLGISLTDGNDEMKSFDEVMGDLRSSFSGLDEAQQAQAAATIFGKESMSGALAIINASEEDYNKLTEAVNESEGAANEMADTMQDNFAGSVKELRSMLEDLFIEVYQNLKPGLEQTVEVLKDVTEWFANLSPEAQENIIKFGLLAAAAGPVLSIFGKLSFGAGTLMQAAGGLTKTIGTAGGKGLAGAVGLLGKSGVVGLAIAGVGALGYGAYKLFDELKNGKEVNLDVAQSFSDQAVDIQNSADTFDRLSNKADASNAELAELNELNKKISQSNNPGEIDELQSRYEDLAKNSGLSKDELNALFTANDNLIEQAPDVQTSISETGEEFIVATDKANEYAQTMRDMAENELRGERLELIEQEQEALDVINEKTKERDELLDRQTTFHERANQYMSDHEGAQQRINEIEDELGDKLKDRANLNEEESRLAREYSDLTAIINDNIGDRNQNYQNGIDPLNETIDANQAIIDKLAEAEMQMANIYLQNVGIKEQGEEGLAQLDETITKNQEEIEQLQEKKSNGEQLTDEERERLTTLQESTDQQEAQRLKIYEELGLYNDINGVLDSKLSKLSEEEQQRIRNKAEAAEINVEEGNIVSQIQDKNSKLAETREELIKNLQQEGATTQEINNQVGELDGKIQRNDEIMKDVLTEAGLWGEVENQINMGADAISGQGYGIDSNNDKTRTGIGLEQERTAEAGSDVDKFVNAQDYGTVRGIDLAGMAGVIKPVTANDGGSVQDINVRAETRAEKLVNLTDGGTLSTLNRRISQPVRKTVNLIGNSMGNLSKALGWAKGTPPSGHPGGDAVIGEKGRELGILPNGRAFISPGSHTFIPDMPKGTHIIPNNKTEKMLRATSSYAEGTNGFDELFNFDRLWNSEIMKLIALFGRNNNSSKEQKTPKQEKDASTKHLEQMINLLSEQVEDSKEMVMLLAQLVAKNPNIQIGEHEFRNVASKVLDKGLGERANKKKNAWGGA
ncbi:phage tail tape measure protein [Oceanobacillus jeddahense]|uniref:phage tail tape measure protein n=1 Tax=Oceanobacillus jeddahense TaxID=1462527 RepID=UPI000945AE6D|nr:phage tail tape measure protein [Oceanobacillus jeddahense]